MELSESRTQGCGFEYESVPMLQKHLMSQASLIKAEVFKHILCERNMQDFKQFAMQLAVPTTLYKNLCINTQAGQIQADQRFFVQ